MNILIVTHVDFWKLEMGSHQRIFSLIEFLKKHFTLYIAYINPRKTDDENYLKKYNLNVIFVEELEKTSFDKKSINNFLDKNPILRNFYNEEITSKFNTIFSLYKFESVIIEYLQLSYFLPLLKDKIVLLDSHDIMYKRAESFEKNKQKHWLNITKEEEFSIFRNYHKVIAIQEDEYNLLIDNKIKSLYCPHPIKVENFVKEKDKKINIIFIGGYSIANKDAIEWFLCNIWKFFIKNRFLNLNIYGNVSSFFKHFDTFQTNIIINGKIENLEEIYKKGTIAINPVQMGGGLKIKNIEAMAYGIPLITTEIGAKGLEKGINNSFLVANTIDEWIEKLLFLILSSTQREKLLRNARFFIEENFNENKSFSTLKNFIEKR
jgi:glycosyltransferase involved in cell wall biosynthesis